MTSMHFLFVFQSQQPFSGFGMKSKTGQDVTLMDAHLSFEVHRKTCTFSGFRNHYSYAEFDSRLKKLFKLNAAHHVNRNDATAQYIESFLFKYLNKLFALMCHY